MPYSCFANPEELEGGQLTTFSPCNEDPSDYVGVKGKNGKLFAITTTCAANALGLLKDDDYAKGNQISAKTALSILSEKLNRDVEGTSKLILEIATNKILDVIAPMLKQYKLKGGEHNIVVIGGGGGASVLVPHTAQRLQFSYKKAEHAEVISSIGVAAAMIHEELEKTIANPKPEDVASLLEEVRQTALAKGALPESITLQSEYVSERYTLRSTAIGNVSLDIGTTNAKEVSREEAAMIACELFGINDREKSNGKANFRY